MKANEAPEKLYFGLQGDTGILDIYSKRESDNDIEYVRKDAFIEKACEYLMDYEFNDSPTIADRRKRVEDFKKYIKI